MTTTTITAHTLYTNILDDGLHGRNLEVDLRDYIASKYESCHGQNITDIVAKRGVALECKQGCGWLVSPSMDYMEAFDLLEQGFKMKKAHYVAYMPKYTSDGDISALRFLTQKQFLDIFTKYNKVRVKKSSAGKYGLAIQSYIPSKSFRASKATFLAIVTDLLETGLTVDQFMSKMGLA